MADRLTVWLGLALILMVGASQLSSCIIYDCGELEPVESGEYSLAMLYSKLNPDYEDLVGAQLIINRDTETSTIRYTRDGTTYEVRHSLTNF